MTQSPPPTDARLAALVPEIALEIAHLRCPSLYMDGRNNPNPSENKLAARIIEWVQFSMTDEWLALCHEGCDYHADPHKGCVLR